MTEPTYTGLSVIEEVTELVKSAVHGMSDEWRPEPIDHLGALRLGSATPEQRAMYSLMMRLNTQHSDIHRKTGLPFGTLEGLDLEHHKLHFMMQVLKQMLMADLTFAYPEIYMQRFGLDSDWTVYVYPSAVLFVAL